MVFIYHTRHPILDHHFGTRPGLGHALVMLSARKGRNWYNIICLRYDVTGIQNHSIPHFLTQCDFSVYKYTVISFLYMKVLPIYVLVLCTLYTKTIHQVSLYDNLIWNSHLPNFCVLWSCDVIWQHQTLTFPS